MAKIDRKYCHRFIAKSEGLGLVIEQSAKTLKLKFLPILLFLEYFSFNISSPKELSHVAGW